MCKRNGRKVAGFIAFMMMFLAVFGQTSIKADAVTVTDKEYVVMLNGSPVFLCNENTIGSKIGTEYFLTYTVDDVSSVSKQHGVVGTSDPTLKYPYEKGVIRFSKKCPESLNMVEQGYTYFIKVTITDAGFRCNITRAKDQTTETLVVNEIKSTESKGLEYFGLWLASSKTKATLTHVRCYDATGQDLGIQLNDGKGRIIPDYENPQKNKTVNHEYEIIVDNQKNVAITHIKKPMTAKVFMEYKVASAELAYKQEGALITVEPLTNYPYSTGMMRFDKYPEVTNQLFMLEVGAEYIVVMEKIEDGLDVYVKKTKNGVTTYHEFASKAVETWYEDSNIFGLWFGGGDGGSFHLTNFKCYDASNNNLQVQCNKIANIIHHGFLEDYAGCEATYYCKENGNSFALYANKSLKFTKEQSVQEGTYQVRDSIMTMELNGEKSTYDYLYKKATDGEGLVYNRLYNYKVNFVTGTGDKIETQKLSNHTGYIPMRPNDPTKEGCEFVGWCLQDGTAYDFDQIVTESITLYAQYSDEEGGSQLASKGTIMWTPITIICSVALLAGVGILVVSIKKGKTKKWQS